MTMQTKLKVHTISNSKLLRLTLCRGYVELVFDGELVVRKKIDHSQFAQLRNRLFNDRSYYLIDGVYYPKNPFRNENGDVYVDYRYLLKHTGTVSGRFRFGSKQKSFYVGRKHRMIFRAFEPKEWGVRRIDTI